MPYAEPANDVAAPTLSAADASALLVELIRTAPPGVTLIQAQCGTGKTTAARRVAIERAVVGNPIAARAPAHSRTTLSVPRHDLALQEVYKLLDESVAAGVPNPAVDYLFSPLSLRLDATGRPTSDTSVPVVCKYAEIAKPLAAGGQSVAWEFCEGRRRRPCEHRDTCPAYGGKITLRPIGTPEPSPPVASRIAVSVHGLLTALDAFAGTSGLRVIDEPPSFLETEMLTADDLILTEQALARFDDRYAVSMAPLLRAVLLWLRDSAPLDEAGHLSRAWALGVDADLLDAAYQATGATSVEEAAAAAFPDEHKGPESPPIRPEQFQALRYTPALPVLLGSASRVLGVLRRAALSSTCTVRVEEHAQGRVLLLTLTNETLRASLLREGQVVVTDAGAHLHLPILARAIGYEPTMHVVSAADGAPIERVLIQVTTASRTAILAHGRLVPSASLQRLVTLMIDWAVEDQSTTTLGIITFAVLELALRASLGEDVSRAWSKAGQSQGVLDTVREAWTPVVRKLRSAPVLAHYGAVTGLDGWKSLDALATLGDPVPNLGEVGREVDYFCTDTTQAGTVLEARTKARAAAELEQAQGRLRTIHRARPARALHVGRVVPGGWPALPGYAVRTVAEGRPVGPSAMSVSEVRVIVAALTRPVAARGLACSERHVGNLVAGKTPVKGAVAEVLRDMYKSLLGDAS